jgi:Cu(I)/Ag(I) efflux system protein CusF
MGARRGHAVLVIASLVLTGCASYQMEPLAVSHPAHPEAPVAPERPPSQTLAYTRSDIPSVQPVSPVAGVPHEGHGSRPMEGGSLQTVVGEGQVVATVPNSSQIVVDHEEIKGFMEAMTMGYRIDPPALLEGLKPGDKIRFTIDIQRRTITAIEKVK